MTACWTTLKEVALVLGALAQEVPLPTSLPTTDGRGGTSGRSEGKVLGGAVAEDDEMADVVDHQKDVQMISAQQSPPLGGGGIVSITQLVRMGDLLLMLLFKVKHSGAVEKAAMGLGALSGRLLRWVI